MYGNDRRDPIEVSTNYLCIYNEEDCKSCQQELPSNYAAMELGLLFNIS